MFWGPFSGQVLNRPSLFLRSWRMFFNTGTGIFDLKYYLKTPQGKILINRFDVLGYSKENAPLWLRRVRTKKNLNKINQAICKKYGQRADVRLFARYGAEAGWMLYSSGEKSLCLT